MPLNKQEIINRVANHFIRDRGVAGWNGHCCVYGSPGDKCRCAIGLFDTEGLLGDMTQAMPRSSYCASEATAFVKAIHDIFPDLEESNEESFRNPGDWGFLYRLQSAHDKSAVKQAENGSSFVALLAIALFQLAEEYQLEVPSCITTWMKS